MVPTDEGVAGALGTDDALNADLIYSLRDTVRSGSASRSQKQKRSLQAVGVGDAAPGSRPTISRSKLTTSAPSFHRRRGCTISPRVRHHPAARPFAVDDDPGAGTNNDAKSSNRRRLRDQRRGGGVVVRRPSLLWAGAAFALFPPPSRRTPLSIPKPHARNRDRPSHAPPPAFYTGPSGMAASA